MIIAARYTSVWDNGVRITTDCRYNTVGKCCFDIEPADVEIDGVLTDEFVTLPDGRELRVTDDVDFDY